jgi:hypothetical protein
MSSWAQSCSTLGPSWSATNPQSYLQHCSCVAVRRAIINPTLSGFIDYNQEAISQLHSQYGSLCYTVLIIFLTASLIECYNTDRLAELEFSNIPTTLSFTHYNVYPFPDSRTSKLHVHLLSIACRDHTTSPVARPYCWEYCWYSLWQSNGTPTYTGAKLRVS